MMEELVRTMRQSMPDAEVHNLADAIWLAAQSVFIPQQVQAKAEDKPWPQLGPTDIKDPPSVKDPEAPAPSPNPKPGESPGNAVDGKPSAELKVDQAVRSGPSPRILSRDLPLRIPAARALPGARELARALRPFRRPVPSRTQFNLDEEDTAQRVAEENIWAPVLKPARARWLEIALVIDDSPSMVLWRDMLKEFRLLLEQLGGFRDVRVWWLDTSSAAKVSLLARANSTAHRQPRELLAPDGCRVIVVASDCLAPAWDGGGMAALLGEWGSRQPVAILQMLPPRLWRRTALDPACGVQHVHVGTREAGSPNHRLARRASRARRFAEPPAGLPVPILTTEPELVGAWAKMIRQATPMQFPAIIFPTQAAPPRPAPAPAPGLPNDPRTRAVACVNAFRAEASVPAFRLARLLAAAPLRVEVMRLVQRVLTPEPRQVHLAEFFLSGLIRRVTPRRAMPEDELDLVDYEFLPGVREVLLDSSAVADMLDVQAAVSGYLAQRFGQTLDFIGIVSVPDQANATDISANNGVFARVSAEILSRLGGGYAEAAKKLSGLVAKDGGTQIDLPPSGPFAGVSILWVDDHPENNRLKAARLADEGAKLTLATSTEEALGLVNHEKFDAIISDLQRGEDEYAGLALLTQLRAAGHSIPFVMYTVRFRRMVAKAAHLGSLICTNDFEAVCQALLKELAQHRQGAPAEEPPMLPPALQANVRRWFAEFELDNVLRDPDAQVSAVLDHLFSVSAGHLWSRIWEVLRRRTKSESATMNAIAKLFNAATESGYVQIWQVRDQTLYLLGSFIQPGKHSYSVASWTGVIGNAAKTRKTLWIPDVNKYPQYIRAEVTTKSELAVVVNHVASGETQLVINIESAENYAFSARQIQWIEAVAKTLARQAPPPPSSPPEPLKVSHTLRAHQSVILRCAWHCDGHLLSTCSVGRTVRIWEVANERVVSVLRGHSQGVNRAVWSPNGSWLASCSFDRTIRIWQTQDWRCLHEIKEHADDIPDIAWSPSGVLASASMDGTIKLWQQADDSWKRTLRITANRSGVIRVSWLGNGDQLCSTCQDKTIRVWDATSGKELQRFTPHNSIPTDTALSPDGVTLATSYFDGNVVVSRFPEGKPLRILAGHRETVRSVSFSPDGKLLASNSGRKGGKVIIWRTDTWEKVREFDQPASDFWPSNLAWAPAVSLLAVPAEGDQVIQLWRVDAESLLEGSNATPSAASSGSGVSSKTGQVYPSGSQATKTEPKLMAKFQVKNGRLSKATKGNYPAYWLDLWIEGAPPETRSVAFEILDESFADRKWTVRRKPSPTRQEFLTDDMNSYGDVDILAEGIGPGAGKWSLKSTLYEALIRFYGEGAKDRQIRLALEQIRDE